MTRYRGEVEEFLRRYTSDLGGSDTWAFWVFGKEAAPLLPPLPVSDSRSAVYRAMWAAVTREAPDEGKARNKESTKFYLLFLRVFVLSCFSDKISFSFPGFKAMGRVASARR